MAIAPDGTSHVRQQLRRRPGNCFRHRYNLPLKVIPVGSGTDNVGVAVSPDGEPFTSLEDPAAAPMQTSPLGITALGFMRATTRGGLYGRG